MISIKRHIVYLLISIFTFFISCKKEQEVKMDCGCESDQIGYFERVYGIIYPDGQIITDMKHNLESCFTLPDSILYYEPNQDNYNDYFLWGTANMHCLEDTNLAYIQIDSAQKIYRGCNGTRIRYIAEIEGYYFGESRGLQTDITIIALCSPIPEHFRQENVKIMVSGYEKWILLSPSINPGVGLMIEVDSIWFKDPPD